MEECRGDSCFVAAKTYCFGKITKDFILGRIKFVFAVSYKAKVPKDFAELIDVKSTMLFSVVRFFR